MEDLKWVEECLENTKSQINLLEKRKVELKEILGNYWDKPKNNVPEELLYAGYNLWLVNEELEGLYYELEILQK